MFHILFAIVPLCTSIQILENESMLFEANRIARFYTPLTAKAAPPSPLPQTDRALDLASNWFSIDLNHIKTDGRSPLAYLAQEPFWEALAEMGFDAVELIGLKGEQEGLRRLQIDPKFGTAQEYFELVNRAMKKDIRLLGTMIGGSTGKGADFALALKNVGDYPSLYSLIEIPLQYWELLPPVPTRALGVNIPWLTLQKIHQLGFVPENHDPYVKESRWMATQPIRGEDDHVRRWIYRIDEKGLPCLDWINPTFASSRLAMGDALQSLLHFQQPLLQLSASLPLNAKETLSLNARKIGACSVAFANGGIDSLKSRGWDLSYDHLTPMATLHALIAEDAEMLRLLYRLMLNDHVQPKTLVHALEPFDRFPCDWAELLYAPNKKHFYDEEEMTADELRRKLLRNDGLRARGTFEGKPLYVHSWEEGCTAMLDPDNLEKRRDQILKLHLLLAEWFAWQPGAFSLSLSDLLGASPQETMLDPLGSNDTLYSCAPNQIKNPYSFASKLRAILAPRNEYALAKAKLLQVLDSDHKAVMLLYYLLPNQMHALLGVNFGKQKITETLESSDYAYTTAIDLKTKLSEKKSLESSFFELQLDPLSAKFILFQPKYQYKP